MTGKALAKSLGVMTTLALTLTVLAAPVSAATPSGTAEIRAAHRTNLAGTTDAPFEITVRNGLTSGTSLSPNVNAIIIVPPPGRYTPVSIATPEGWTSTLTSEGLFLLETEESTIGPGGSAVFTVTANVSRPSVDVSRRWRVYLSSDGGQTNAEAEPTTPGALDTTIRVLQVTGVTLTAPAGVVDNSATQQQTADVRVDVFNAGSGTLDVTADLFVDPNDPDNSTTADTSCSATPTSVLAQTAASFACTATFGNPGELTLIGDASATGADGLAASSPLITVMSKVALTYNAQSLQPTDVSPGNAYTFRLSVDKDGQVAATIDQANTTLTFGPNGEFQASLAEPATFPPGDNNTVLLEFVPTTVPTTIPDSNAPVGGYTPSLVVTGTDENDLGFEISPSIGDKISVDSLGPDLELSFTPPPSRVEGADPAASNGQTQDLGGTVEDRGSLCRTCPIVSSVLRQYNSAGQPISPDISVEISNNGGTLSGSYSGDYDPNARSVELVVTASDLAGNPTTEASNRVDVDNILPNLVSARSGGADGRDRTRIVAILDERVAVSAAMSPSDWAVAGHRVVAAEPQPSSRGFNRVQLTVDPPLGRNEVTSLTYQPSAATRAFDRVGLEVVNTTLTVADGIIPQLPEVDLIGGLPRQDGQFWINDDTPDVTVSQVDPGDTVSIYQDNNGNGQIDEGTDTLKSSCPVFAGNSVTCTLSSFGTVNQTVTLLLRSHDANSNQGPTAVEALTLDFVPPAITAAELSGDDIVVTFNDVLTDLRGRNHTFDWVVRADDGGEPVKFPPQSVSGSRDSRTLHGNGDWSQAGVTVTDVVYDYNGPEGDRYADRAGNDLPNQVFTL